MGESKTEKLTSAFDSAILASLASSAQSKLGNGQDGRLSVRLCRVVLAEAKLSVLNLASKSPNLALA